MTYTTARADRDLDRVAAGLAHRLQVQRPMRALVLATIDHQRCRVGRHLHAGRPIGVHLSIFVVEAFQLNFQIGSAHKRIVDGRL